MCFRRVCVCPRKEEMLMNMEEDCIIKQRSIFPKQRPGVALRGWSYPVSLRKAWCWPNENLWETACHLMERITRKDCQGWVCARGLCNQVQRVLNKELQGDPPLPALYEGAYSQSSGDQCPVSADVLVHVEPVEGSWSLGIHTGSASSIFLSSSDLREGGKVQDWRRAGSVFFQNRGISFGWTETTILVVFLLLLQQSSHQANPQNFIFSPPKTSFFQRHVKWSVLFYFW